MAIAVQSLINDIRILSGLRNNQLFSDPMIAELASDAYASLRDIMIVRFAHWFASYYAFTLNGGTGGNTLDLTLIPDLQMDQCLDQIQGSQNFTVLALGSLAERNQYGNNFGAGFGGLRYFTNGDTLEVLPASAAAGSYNLTYTPQYTVLAVPTYFTRKVTPIAISTLSGDAVVAATHEWTFANLVYNPATIIGQTLFITGAAHGDNDGAHTIADFSTPTLIITDGTQTLTNETFAATVQASIFNVNWSVSNTGTWSIPGANFNPGQVGELLVCEYASNSANNG